MKKPVFEIEKGILLKHCIEDTESHVNKDDLIVPVDASGLAPSCSGTTMDYKIIGYLILVECRILTCKERAVSLLLLLIL